MLGDRHLHLSPFFCPSVEEILLVVRGEVVLRTGLAAEMLAVADLLQVVQAARDAAIAVGVESVVILQNQILQCCTRDACRCP